MSSYHIAIAKLTVRVDLKIAVCLVILFALFIRLGIWQLDRAEEKRQTQNFYNERLTASPVAIETLWPALREGEHSQYSQGNFQSLRISLRGRFLNDQSILLLNKHYRGQVGYEVVTPLLLSSGDGLVLVSRGWTEPLAVTADNRSALAVTGEQILVAALSVPHARTFFKTEQPTNGQWPVRLHQIDIATLQNLFAEPLFPYLARLEAENPGVLARHWTPVNIDPDKSRNYAIQWFGMAVALALVTLFLSTNLRELLKL